MGADWIREYTVILTAFPL